MPAEMWAWRWVVGRDSELSPSALVSNSLYNITKEYLTLSELHNMIGYTPMEFVQEFLKCVTILETDNERERELQWQNSQQSLAT